MKNQFDLKFVEKLVNSKYGIKAKAIQIEGETDDNFKMSNDDNSFFFKIYPAKTKIEFVQFQTKILKNLECNINTARNVVDKKNNFFSHFIDEGNDVRYVRMNTWIHGRLWSSINPLRSTIREQLGFKSATLLKDLQREKLTYERKDFHWDLANFEWIKSYYKKIGLNKKYLLTIKQLLDNFKKNRKKYDKLRKWLIHNDLNDNNIVVSNDLKNPKIKGFIDFGDSIKSQLINELSVTCTYGIVKSLNPLKSACEIIKGFHSVINIHKEEIDFLYDLILMRICVSVVKSCLNKKLNSENKYLQISNNDMNILFDRWSSLNKELATCFFRDACSLSPISNEKKFKKLIKHKRSSINTLFQNSDLRNLKNLDLSVSSNWLSNELINDVDSFEKKINFEPNLIYYGGYMETRVVYDSEDYEKLTDSGFENRTTHLGIDFWVKENTTVHSIEDGIIKVLTNDKTIKGYGGLIIIEHNIENIKYYSLYGHLSNQNKSKYKVGDRINRGEKIGEIGANKENGGWCPHLHFQIILTLLDFEDDFPGVCMEDEKMIWSSICPDPKLILEMQTNKNTHFNENELKNLRTRFLGRNLKLSYDLPIYIVRGFNQYLYSNKGKKYLDTVNNIAHVGHQNINVVNAAKDQIGLLNTNTRYLHHEILSLSKNLLSKFPKKLSKVYYVNSGSEANELALRMTSLYSKSEKFIVFEGGYHGNTNKTIEVSNYKYKSEGGRGKSENIYEIPMPDKFRGKHRGKDSTNKYYKELEKIISRASKSDEKISAMIFEPIISCGGQIELPSGFLKKCSKILKKFDILMISDEVQTGFGRVGEKYWGYELHGIIPDIVTLGKPMGNGHPIGAVVCSEKIAQKFDNGLEFFSSFGGNPVSCKIANEVIKEIDSKNLQSNAKKIGKYLKESLNKLAKKHSIIRDVRGTGLFIGFELVNDKLVPQAEKANYLVNRMKEMGVLMSTDGLEKNVIKIKPPIIFSFSDTDRMLTLLEKVFNEDFMHKG